MKRQKTLKRERISKALTSIFDYPLIIIEAPMGYGKTTAVKEFLASRRGNHVLWISFLKSEDTTSFFWDGFVKEIGKLNETVSFRLKSLGFPSDTPQTANILLMLNEIEYEEDTALVIDDYHLVKSPQIGDFLSQIVREELDNLHIVVITRDTTNLDFAEITAKGLCHIISQQVLKFSYEEIRSYCNMMGYILTEEDVTKISEYTGGCISLVYLILLGIKKGIPIGRSQAIDDLVESVLYNTYDKRIKKFMLRMAVMDSFTMEQAIFVSRESRAEEFLKKLRRENAFIDYDETMGVYRIHNVMLDFLRVKQKGYTGLKTLYRRVAEWHLKLKEYIRAYEYLYQAGETEQILTILNSEGTVTNAYAEFEGSLDMFKNTPRELLFKYPMAYLQYISLLLLSGKSTAAEDGAVRLDELQKYYEGMGNIHPNQNSRILAEINAVRVFGVFNDAEKMIACTNEALRLLEGEKSCLMLKESEFTFGSPHFLYSYHTKPGKLRQTVDTMVTNFPVFSRLSDGCGTGCEYVTLAEYALETGQWQEAELNAFKAIYKARTKEQTGITICASFTLSRLYIQQGKTTEGLELLSRLRKEVIRENNAIYNTTLDLCDGYINGCLQRIDKIPPWLREGDMSPARFLYQGMAFNYIVYGKAVLLSKNYIELEMLTEALTQYFSIFNNQLGFLHNIIFDAAAKYRLYGMEKGCAALKKALDIGRPDHIILPFGENAPAILDMVRLLSKLDNHDEYAREVLLCCEQYMESLKYISRETVSLTSREIEVLSLAAEGLKRGEIAERLMVSTGTVRTHLSNIYQKLEVSGKTAAIKKAEKLKLF